MRPYRTKYCFRKRLLIGVLTMSAAGCNSTAAVTANADSQQELRARDSAEVGQTAIASPLGMFILVRRGATKCGIKFTKFHREGEYKSADYEWFAQINDGHELTKANGNFGQGRVSDTPSFGIGKFSFKPFANTDIICGAMHLSWFYPISIGFFHYAEGGWRQDNDLELAPTKLVDIRAVNFADPRLRWYKVSRERPRVIFIPVADLPH